MRNQPKLHRTSLSDWMSGERLWQHRAPLFQFSVVWCMTGESQSAQGEQGDKHERSEREKRNENGSYETDDRDRWRHKQWWALTLQPVWSRPEPRSYWGCNLSARCWWSEPPTSRLPCSQRHMKQRMDWVLQDSNSTNVIVEKHFTARCCIQAPSGRQSSKKKKRSRKYFPCLKCNKYINKSPIFDVIVFYQILNLDLWRCFMNLSCFQS